MILATVHSRAQPQLFQIVYSQIVTSAMTIIRNWLSFTALISDFIHSSSALPQGELADCKTPLTKCNRLSLHANGLDGKKIYSYTDESQSQKFCVAGKDEAKGFRCFIGADVCGSLSYIWNRGCNAHRLDRL
jgi:hypothetical protein